MKKELCKNKKFQNTKQFNEKVFPKSFDHTFLLFFPLVCTNKSQRLGILHSTSYTFVGVKDVHQERFVT